MNCRCKYFRKTLYFSGNAHLPKYNICGWLICGERKLADVVVKEEGDNLFICICKQFSTKKAVGYGNYLSLGRRLSIPDLKLSDTMEYHIGKYGRMRQRFLKENHGGIYSYMILAETLWKHLAEIVLHDRICSL